MSTNNTTDDGDETSDRPRAMSQDIHCPGCGLTVPTDRAADLETPAGPVSVCQSCHRYLRVDHWFLDEVADE